MWDKVTNGAGVSTQADFASSISIMGGKLQLPSAPVGMDSGQGMMGFVVQQQLAK